MITKYRYTRKQWLEKWYAMPSNTPLDGLLSELLEQEPITTKDKVKLLKCGCEVCQGTKVTLCDKHAGFIPITKDKEECSYCKDNGFVYDKVICPKCKLEDIERLNWSNSNHFSDILAGKINEIIDRLNSLNK